MARTAFRLTSERLSLMQHFVRYRYLRMSHLYKLSRGYKNISERAVRRLTRDFWAHGCLCRRVAPPYPGRLIPGGEFAYWLSKKGAGLAEQAGIARSALPLPRAAIARTLNHELAITDFHIAAQEACDASSLKLHWEQYRLRRSVNPDAMFGVTNPALPEAESTSYYFIEVETNPTSGYAGGQPALLRRLQRYAAYQGSEDCITDWRWFSEFRVIVMVSSHAQQRSLLNTLRTHLPSPMFLVGVLEPTVNSLSFESPVAGAPHNIWG